MHLNPNLRHNMTQTANNKLLGMLKRLVCGWLWLCGAVLFSQWWMMLVLPWQVIAVCGGSLLIAFVAACIWGALHWIVTGRDMNQ